MSSVAPGSRDPTTLRVPVPVPEKAGDSARAGQHAHLRVSNRG